jgi:hypothetical protein
MINGYSSQIGQWKSNPKSYWSLVKKLMGKSTSSPIPPLQNEATGEFVVNDEDKANSIICRIGFDTLFKQSNNYSRFPH